MADLFSEIYDGRKEYFVSPDKEIDFIITKRNKAEIIGEVKWKIIDSEDISKFLLNSERFSGKKVLICKNSKVKSDQVQILIPQDLIDLVKKSRERLI